jgi:hypothetical protein
MVDQSRERTPEQPGERLSTQPSTTQDGARGNPAVQEAPTTWRRPGLLTFAAVMMFALGGFQLLLAISEFASGTWVLGSLDTVFFIQSLIILGIIDVVIGLIALFGGISILRGGAFGWLFHIPVSPVLAVVIIVLDVLVIYGLAKYTDDIQGIG